MILLHTSYGKRAKWAKQESLSSRLLRFYQGRAQEASSRLLEKGEGPFRVILLLGTTLGYFQVEQDIQTLREIGSLAHHNCLLITETENRDWRIRNFQPYVDYKFKKVFIHESWSMSLETSIAEGKSYYYEVLDQGKSLCLALELAVKMRLYSLHELVALLERAGWNFLRSYDGLRSLDHATVESPDLLTLSKKVA